MTAAVMDLSGFDPSTMTYLATQMSHPNMGGHVDPFQDMLLPDMRDYGGYAGSDELTMHSIHGAQPLVKPYPSTYDDPFSDVVSAFDHPAHHDHPDAEAPSIDRDNKLLSFSPPNLEYALLDYTYRRTSISLAAQLHGMFFLAESPWASAADAQIAPAELTCYRRNLFQITGEITLPRGLRYIMTDQGEQIPIMGQELVISATESTEGNPVKVISVPWKTPVNPNVPVVEDKIEREPTSIPLDVMSVQDLNTEFATFPFQWKRLQFRIATANNGRRKELQQHFVVRLKVLASLANGGKIPICEVQSGAIIVRGRSPRNFQSRKDLPLNGTGHVRKSNGPGNLTRTSSGDSVGRAKLDAPTSMPAKPEPPPIDTSVISFFDPNEPASASQVDLPEWKAAGGAAGPGGASASVPFKSSPPDGNHAFAVASPVRTVGGGADLRRKSSAAVPTAPVQLSLVEDDSPKSSSNLHGSSGPTPPDGSGRAAKRMHLQQRQPSFALNTINSPDESADLLYEYFPLGLDDWMPPVDAVYRPHVVHHTKLPSDPRDPATIGKSARSKRLYQ